MTPRSAIEMDAVFNKGGKTPDNSKLNPFEKDTWPTFLLEIKVKGSQFADLSFSIKETGLDTDDNEEALEAIAKEIQDFNDFIIGGGSND